MNLNKNFDQENNDLEKVVPLGNDEIKSILKTQSEAVFQDKNLTNNSNFTKKTLIDIALDFKSKESKNEKLENTDNIKEEGAEPEISENIEQISNEVVNQTEKTDKDDTSNELDNLSDQSSSELELVNQNNDEHDTASNEFNSENNQSDSIAETNTEIDLENVNSQNQDQIDKNEIISKTNIKVDETQQACE